MKLILSLLLAAASVYGSVVTVIPGGPSCNNVTNGYVYTAQGNQCVWAAGGGGGGGVDTVGTFSGSPQTNGATISGNVITFGPASATVPGMVSTGAQSLAGAKAITADTFTLAHDGNSAQVKLESSSDGVSAGISFVDLTATTPTVGFGVNTTPGFFEQRIFVTRAGVYNTNFFFDAVSSFLQVPSINAQSLRAVGGTSLIALDDTDGVRLVDGRLKVSTGTPLVFNSDNLISANGSLSVINPAASPSSITLKNASATTGTTTSVDTSGHYTTDVGDGGDTYWKSGGTIRMTLTAAGILHSNAIGALSNPGSNLDMNYGGSGGNKSLNRFIGDTGAENDNRDWFGASANFGGDDLRFKYGFFGTGVCGSGCSWNTPPTAGVQSSSGVRLATNGTTQPTCDATIRGTLWNIEGASGVADILQICQKTVLDTYAWVTK